MTTSKDDIVIKYFKTPAQFETWLAKNHAASTGLYLQIYNKDSGVASLNHADALDVALCYGWIDAIAKKYDDQSYLQRFTPRRSKSIWSKRNIEHVERLIKAGRMKESGLKAIEAAKADGRWDAAYDSPANSEIPDDFLKLLKKNKSAYQFFKTLNKTNTFAITWRLQTAKKPETRERRMQVIIAMLEKGETFH
ncbi:Uncharacterized conserved protein YdeI, YjbR/CyaY-like superfamily, DUF1801 family [Chitinophaga sp. CF118]|uniref:YdeI/OmpD-associated family protein n=1 Tax=Chitinophaga sp. CF118 TaxID=1884367 RepID=UPI0008E7D10F|nr:YdeI/OmpD-associated family protein [Chitinophaga sp. CF118]SFD16877.1 Uncharacterized conserved protein YdeI, YjbR/CyaY-like superfamily, DUF1801 family [Chitinophaga sp. CF118]